MAWFAWGTQAEWCSSDSHGHSSEWTLSSHKKNIMTSRVSHASNQGYSFIWSVGGTGVCEHGGGIIDQQCLKRH